MNQESDFETFGEQPFFGELEDEYSGRRRFAQGSTSPQYAAAMRRARALRQQRLSGTQYRNWTLPPRPRPNRFPIRFSRGGPPFPLGSDVGFDQALTPSARPACNCPSCGDQPNVTQPPLDQPVDDPRADNAAATSASDDQPDVSQSSAGDELSEFFYPQNEFEYLNSQGEVNQTRARNGGRARQPTNLGAVTLCVGKPFAVLDNFKFDSSKLRDDDIRKHTSQVNAIASEIKSLAARRKPVPSVCIVGHADV